MSPEDCYKIGQIVKVHGTKGEVVAELDVEYPEELIDLESVFVEINQKLVPFFIDDMSINDKRAIVKFEDIDSVEDAKVLLKKALYVKEEDLPEGEDAAFIIEGVVGYRVKDEAHGDIGTVVGYMERPVQDLLVVDYQGKEVYVPIDEAIVLNVDKKNRLVQVSLPDGLLDL